MPREPKPVELLQGHRTKDELKLRRDEEAAMLTGTPMRRFFKPKDHPTAAREFSRIKKLLGKIKKDDDLYSRSVNTHCILVEECEQVQDIRDQFIASKEELGDAYRNGECGDPKDRGIGAAEYYRLLAKLSESIINCDKQLMSKRQMILAIDRENILTAQSALRSIQKRPEKKQKTGMAAFMEHRAGGG